MASDIIELIEKEAWDSHVVNTENPHVVTAEQTGALPLTGGELTGDVTSSGAITAATLTSNGDINAAANVYVAQDIIVTGAVVGIEGGTLGNAVIEDLADTYTTDNTGRIVVANSIGKLISKTPANLNAEMTAASIGTDYSTSKFRGIQASSTDLTAGSSALSNGQIYLCYE